MRWLGIDLGRKRIGLALSDASATLARPWKTIAGESSPEAIVQRVALELTALRRETLGDAEVDGIVIGLPRRLGGDDNATTGLARTVAAVFERHLGLPVHLQDERLTSREAEERLALRERDWRKRKPLIDAMAAAIILQDFLDTHTGTEPPVPVQ